MAARQEQKKLKKQIEKKQINGIMPKRSEVAEQTVGTAAKGTIDYIKKIGGKSHQLL